MIPALFLLLALPAFADDAYSALKNRQYESAISLFLTAIEASPKVPSLRKDLAYTYLKVGRNEAARDQFNEAARLDPKDFQAALEYAFLCFETKRQAEARRVFGRVRKTGDPAARATAERAFHNIDDALVEGIARWSQALQHEPDNFSAHRELAQLAEQRDELALAATHYERAWKLKPLQRALMLDLGRVWTNMGRTTEAEIMLLAASRGDEARVAEAARELLPSRYPYVYEFREALKLDPENVELHRELAYLLLEMKQNTEAESEFTTVLARRPDDLMSAAQLGFLKLARNDNTGAMVLLERVLAGRDEELADRARFMLKLPRAMRQQEEAPRTKVSVEAKTFAERSFQKGYLQDAQKYYNIAHQKDPLDFNVMLKLGWTNNLLRNDRSAKRWFDLARLSRDAKVADEAGRAYRNLEADERHLRLSTWLYPMYSSRWRDVFLYGQIKAELRFSGVPLRPYISTRIIGDTRRTLNTGAVPHYLSESSLILAGGLATPVWKGITGWAEAGSAANYLTHKMLPDYRGGISVARRFGRRTFFETNADGVFVSRFGNDTLLSSQNRAGYAVAPRVQVFWNSNFTIDWKRAYWANFVEGGPGVALKLPNAMVFSMSVLRGAYTVNQGNPRRPNYFDVRGGIWYAFSH